jgi:hypothetical protein
MIRWRDHREASRDAGRGEAALGRVAAGLADAIHTVLPRCTAALVVVGEDSGWRLLAKRGAVDVSSGWREAAVCQVRDSDRSFEEADYLVAPFSAVALHVVLVLAPSAGEPLTEGAHVIVQPLLDAGGILLDQALTEGRRDVACRRVVEDELRAFETTPDAKQARDPQRWLVGRHVW